MTDVIEIEYPENPNPVLELWTPVSGRLEVYPGGEKMVEGTILYDIPEWKPYVHKSSDRVRIEQEERWLHTHWDNPKNDWNLNLGKTKPFQLRVKSGVSRSKLSLGGVPLTRVSVSSGVGACKVWFDEENPETMQLLKVEAGVGQTEMDNVLNANPHEVKVNGGVGELRVGLTGKAPENDVHVRINGGVGGITLTISEDVSAVIRVNGLTGVDLRGKVYSRRRSFGSGVYETEAYNADDPSLDIRVSLGLGGLTIRTV